MLVQVRLGATTIQLEYRFWFYDALVYVNREKVIVFFAIKFPLIILHPEFQPFIPFGLVATVNFNAAGAQLPVMWNRFATNTVSYHLCAPIIYGVPMALLDIFSKTRPT